MPPTSQAGSSHSPPEEIGPAVRGARGQARRALHGASAPLTSALFQAGEMVELLAAVIHRGVSKPRGYWGDVRQQAYELLRLCWLPMIVSTGCFGFAAPGLQAGNLVGLFGIPERLGSLIFETSEREFSPWINAMVVAGVVGTATTADLGARRVREEFDAMEVLGVDPIRETILPRVVAMTIMTGLMDVMALTFGVVGGWLAALECGSTTAGFFNNGWANATVQELIGSVTKTTLFGLIVAVVCNYKGYRAQGGPIGVGKAVNQAVVISFAAIYIVNYVFTALLLGLNPEMQVYR